MLNNVLELSWEDWKKFIYIPDGSFPDIYVLNTNEEDWRIWVDFVNSEYEVVFTDENDQRYRQLDFAAIRRYFASNKKGNSPSANIIAGRVIINCFFYSERGIINDIDPREINTWEDHRQLIHYLTSISTLLNKKVVLEPEGSWYGAADAINAEYEPMLTVNGEAVLVAAYWRTPQWLRANQHGATWQPPLPPTGASL